jgi:uncharacterized membrane protein YciS (DUF1049 family)
MAVILFVLSLCLSSATVFTLMVSRDEYPISTILIGFAATFLLAAFYFYPQEVEAKLKHDYERQQRDLGQIKAFLNRARTTPRSVLEAEAND